MSALEKAVADAQAAEQQAQQLQLIAAVLQAQQAVQQPACGCQHQAPVKARRSPAQVAAIAGAVCACGAVATAMFLAVALTAVAVSVSALVALWLVREIRRGSK